MNRDYLNFMIVVAECRLKLYPTTLDQSSDTAEPRHFDVTYFCAIASRTRPYCLNPISRSIPSFPSILIVSHSLKFSAFRHST